MKKILIIVLLTAVLLGIGLYYTSPNNPEYKQFKQDELAKEALHQGNMSVYFKNKDTKYLISHKNKEAVILAQIYAMTGHYDRAYAILDQVNAKKNFKSYGECLKKRAIDRPFCVIASKFKPNYKFKYDKNLYISYIKSDQGNLEEALKYYNLSKKKDSCFNAYLQAKLKDYETAAKTIKACRKTNYVNIVKGILAEQEDNYELAYQHYNRASYSYTPRILLDVANAYLSIDDVEKANDSLNKILEQYPYHKKALELYRE